MARFIHISLLVLLALAGASLSVRAQDPMAKWKPHAGDRYTYHFQYSDYGGVRNIGHGAITVDDTITQVILSSNYYLDAVHPLVVATSDTSYFWFMPSQDSLVSLPLVIQKLTGSYYDGYNFDFSKDSGSTVMLQGRPLHTWGACESNGNPVEDGWQYNVGYSPEIRWFVSQSWFETIHTGAMPGKQQPLDVWEYIQWTYTLISADVSASGVAEAPNAPIIDVSCRSGAIDVRISAVGDCSLALLDLLGRPIRSWQMPVEAGERRITLNVADAPNGVYFLRVQGGGVDAVKKVCIAH